MWCFFKGYKEYNKDKSKAMKFLVCFIGLLLGLGNKADAQQCASMADIKKVHDFIAASWNKTVRFSPEDTGTLIGISLYRSEHE